MTLGGSLTISDPNSFNMSSSTGSFETGTGPVHLNADTTLGPNKKLIFQSNSFTTSFAGSPSASANAAYLLPPAFPAADGYLLSGAQSTGALSWINPNTVFDATVCRSYGPTSGSSACAITVGGSGTYSGVQTVNIGSQNAVGAGDIINIGTTATSGSAPTLNLGSSLLGGSLSMSAASTTITGGSSGIILNSDTALANGKKLIITSNSVQTSFQGSATASAANYILPSGAPLNPGYLTSDNTGQLSWTLLSTLFNPASCPAFGQLSGCNGASAIKIGASDSSHFDEVKIAASGQTSIVSLGVSSGTSAGSVNDILIGRVTGTGASGALNLITVGSNTDTAAGGKTSNQITIGSSSALGPGSATAFKANDITIGLASGVGANAQTTNEVQIATATATTGSFTQNKVTIGNAAGASGSNILQLGVSGATTGVVGNTITIGAVTGATSSATQSIAIGTSTATSGLNTLDIFKLSSVGASQVITLGTAPGANTGGNAITIGSYASPQTVSPSANKIDIGIGNVDPQTNTIRIGVSAATSSIAGNTITIGAVTGATSSATQSIAIGTSTATSGSNTLDIFKLAVAGAASQAITLGTAPGANTGGNAITIGSYASPQTVSPSANKIDIGIGNVDPQTNTIRIGVSAATSSTVGNTITIGSVTASGFATNTINIGLSAAAANSIILGQQSGTAAANQAITIGTSASTALGAANTIKLGELSATSGTATQSISIGQSGASTTTSTINLGSQTNDIVYVKGGKLRISNTAATNYAGFVYSGSSAGDYTLPSTFPTAFGFLGSDTTGALNWNSVMMSRLTATSCSRTDPPSNTVTAYTPTWTSKCTSTYENIGFPLTSRLPWVASTTGLDCTTSGGCNSPVRITFSAIATSGATAANGGGYTVSISTTAGAISPAATTGSNSFLCTATSCTISIDFTWPGTTGSPALDVYVRCNDSGDCDGSSGSKNGPALSNVVWVIY